MDKRGMLHFAVYASPFILGCCTHYSAKIMATFAVVIGNVHSVVCVCSDGNDKWSKVCSLYCNTVYICTKQISEEQPPFLSRVSPEIFFAFSLPLYYPTQNIISHSDLFLPPSIHKPRLQTAENKGNLYCGFKECP